MFHNTLAQMVAKGGASQDVVNLMTGFQNFIAEKSYHVKHIPQTERGNSVSQSSSQLSSRGAQALGASLEECKSPVVHALSPRSAENGNMENMQKTLEKNNDVPMLSSDGEDDIDDVRVMQVFQDEARRESSSK